MKKIWILTIRELHTFFDSLVAYILIIIFLGVCGLFTWLIIWDVFISKQASMGPFFQIAYWILLIFIPGITMRMFAEENRTGTIELLLTKAITDWQVVIGKYLACMLLIIITLAFTLPYYISIGLFLGDIDHGAVWGGYLGLILLSSAYVGIGLFTSSITNNQIVAFLLAFLFGVLFQGIFLLLSNQIPGFLGMLMDYLSSYIHYEALTRGIIDSKDVLFFLSFTLLGLVLAESMLSKRNLTN